MHIVALIIIALCLLVITYKRPKLGLIAFGCLLLITGLFFWLTPTDSTDKKAGPLTEFANLSETKVRVGYADTFVLTGRVSNTHAKESIEELTIRSTLNWCETEDSCVVLGDETNLLKEFVPARQARDFSINLSSRLQAESEGVIKWEHVVASAK